MCVFVDSQRFPVVSLECSRRLGLRTSREYDAMQEKKFDDEDVSVLMLGDGYGRLTQANGLDHAECIIADGAALRAIADYLDGIVKNTDQGRDLAA